MKRITAFIVVLMFFANAVRAQYVNIPDSNFRKFLIGRCPSCFNSSKMMDTTCSWLDNIITIDCSDKNIKSLDGIQYFKKIIDLKCNNNLIDSLYPLPKDLIFLSFYKNKINHLPSLPLKLKTLNCSNNLIDSLPKLNDSLNKFECAFNKLVNLPVLPGKLRYLNCDNNYLTKLPQLPDSLNTLTCNSNKLDSLPNLPNRLQYLYIDSNNLTQLKTLPNSLKLIYCNYNKLLSLPQLPTSLTYINVNFNYLTSLPSLPTSLFILSCDYNLLTQLPNLPDSLGSLSCSNNKLAGLPALNSKLSILQCPYNLITILPNLPASISFLNITDNKLTQLPSLPKKIKSLSVNNNQLTSIPSLGDSLRSLHLGGNLNLSCLPLLPSTLKVLSVKNTNIQCFPNMPINLNNNFPFPNLSICNATSNPNHCQSFPQIQSRVFIDNNFNNIKDSNDFYRENVKATLFHSNYTYTNSKGQFQIAADSLGAYVLTIFPPPFYNAIPSSVNFNFGTYDTLVNLPDIALQPNTLKDSLFIKATPLNWAARPGFKYPYLIQYENLGTTVVAPNINFNYDNSLLVYDSSSNHLVSNNGSNLSLALGNFSPGQFGSFVAYFRVNVAAALGANLLNIATINAGTTVAIDSSQSIVRGSYDPNDKQATPTLTTQQVDEGNYINYTIRFQNTGTDTAINVVIADTLNHLLQANNFQVVSSSHPCKTTIKGKTVYFEFFDIYLPDSNVNQYASNGFVNFKVRPIQNVSAGDIIPNTAHIYFDYNKAIKTNIATTTIAYPVPLKLISFNAVVQQENNVLVKWNTLNEVNTSYFILEQSNDGKNFKGIAEIPAKGSGNNQYLHLLNSGGITFLRLKIVDKDGKIEYSNIIQVAPIDREPISVLTNPTTHYLSTKTNAVILNKTVAKIINSYGITVKSFMLQSGLQQIDISNLKNGVYYLQTNLKTIKVVVEK